MKLLFVEEKKWYRNIRKEFEDIWWSFIVFSDFSSLGFFVDYDLNFSDENEFGGSVFFVGEE